MHRELLQAHNQDECIYPDIWKIHVTYLHRWPGQHVACARRANARSLSPATQLSVEKFTDEWGNGNKLQLVTG